MAYRIIFLVALSLLQLNVVWSQCVQTVDYTTWRRTGDSTYVGSSGWQITNNGTELTSQQNTNFPRMFVGPDTLMNVRVTGTFRVEDNSDDDYVGFVFCFKETWNQAWYNTQYMYHEYYLFDWKKNSQTWSGYSAPEGFSLDKVDGNYQRTIAGVFPSFWVHGNNANFNVLQTWYSSTNGWVSYTYYDFELLLTPTRATVFIDSDTIFDQTGCFEPGLFGFYNYSQANARYLNFNYELYVNFLMDASNVCVGDTSHMFFLDTSACNTTNTFSNLDTFYWDLGDGSFSTDTNPEHLYANAGYYDVSLIATDVNGCTDTAQQTLYVHSQPQADFVFEHVCKGDSMYFFDSTQVQFGEVQTWLWDFGDGTATDSVADPVHLYNQAGDYSVTLIAQNAGGCYDTVVHQVTVYALPQVAMNIVSACEQHAVELHNLSSATDWPLASFEWDIDADSQTDFSGDTVVHLFDPYGNYPITLYVTDSFGCLDSLTDLAVVYPKPDADFAAPSVCFNEPSTFSDSSAVALGQITGRHWYFGAIDYTGAAVVSNLFATAGNHLCSLIVTTDFGCLDTVIKQVEVYHLPVAQFQIEPQCEDIYASFIQSSTSQSGVISQYQWNLGQGSSSFSSNPLHAFPTAGLHRVTLTVETNYGCTDTAQGNARIYPAPQAAFSWNNVCEGDVLKFTDQSSIQQTTPGGDVIQAWQWVFNNSVTTNVQHPEYAYTHAQSVETKLYVFSNYGCIDSAFNVPLINSLPEVIFNSEIGCSEDTSSFLDQSKVRNAIINRWNWDFGDGETATVRDPKHVYERFGTYKVTLSVKSNFNCQADYARLIEVPETPQVDFIAYPSEGCDPLETKLNNETTYSGNDLAFKWFINGQLKSFERSAELVLHNDTIAPLGFDVLLIATSDQGCTAQRLKEQNVWVLPSPNAQFSLKQDHISMLEPTAFFDNQSEHGVRWFWDFGDGKKSNDFAPAHVYEKSGNFEINLVAWNEFYCTDSADAYLEIDPLTTLYIPSAFTPNGDGVNDTWSVVGLNEGKEFRMHIYNRWGEELFDTSDMEFSWDGHLNGGKIKAPTGTYVYDIYYFTSDDQYRELKGSFSLIR